MLNPGWPLGVLFFVFTFYIFQVPFFFFFYTMGWGIQNSGPTILIFYASRPAKASEGISAFLLCSGSVVSDSLPPHGL